MQHHALMHWGFLQEIPDIWGHGIPFLKAEQSIIKNNYLSVSYQFSSFFIYVADNDFGYRIDVFKSTSVLGNFKTFC